MENSNSVSLKTQTEVSKFHEWLERNRNIHLADVQAMDRAYNIVQENIEKLQSSRKPVNARLSKF